MTFGRRHKNAAIAACLAILLGVASAGELARLHRELAETAAPPLQQPVAPPQGEKGGAPGVQPLLPLPQREPLPRIERIGYEALGCRGFCRAFTVILAADGTFSYVGEANVERLGDHTGRVDASALERLMRYVAEIDYRGLEDTYASPFADVQTTYTMVDYGDEVKVVQDQGGAAPATVWALGRLIQDLLEDASWD